MASRRKEIRQAVVAALKGNTAAGDEVYSNLSSAIWREQLPQIVVYQRSEDIETLNVSPKEYKKTLELAVEIIGEGSETPDTQSVLVEDLVDDIADEVEELLSIDDTLADFEDPLGKIVALVDELILIDTEFEFRGDGAKPVASVKLIYNALYTEYRPGTTDDQDISEMNSMNVKYRVGHNDSSPDDVVELEDDLDLTEQD